MRFNSVVEAEEYLVFVVLVKNPLDLRHIDPEFTREPVSASVGCSQSHSTCVLSASVREADDAFAGFSYAPPIDL
uniref:Protein kinase C-terminal domain-containing protein n=1 Tax=Timema poppense TaxID=170557 RepID=A0A7R9CWT1_TIMPO|nr:unnamed protein product [Timema poppensis]